MIVVVEIIGAVEIVKKMKDKSRRRLVVKKIRMAAQKIMTRSEAKATIIILQPTMAEEGEEKEEEVEEVTNIIFFRENVQILNSVSKSI